MLTLIGGLCSVQEGSLTVLSRELHGASNDQLVQVRCYIGYIFQAHNLLEFLTARQNVQMSLELHKEIPDQEVRTKLEAILQAVKNGEPDELLPLGPFRRAKAKSSHCSCSESSEVGFS